MQRNGEAGEDDDDRDLEDRGARTRMCPLFLEVSLALALADGETPASFKPSITAIRPPKKDVTRLGDSSAT